MDRVDGGDDGRRYFPLIFLLVISYFSLFFLFFLTFQKTGIRIWRTFQNPSTTGFLTFERAKLSRNHAGLVFLIIVESFIFIEINDSIRKSLLY